MHASTTSLTQALAHSKTSSGQQKGWRKVPLVLADLTFAQGARRRLSSSSCATAATGAAAAGGGALAGGVYSNASRTGPNALVGVGSRRGAHAHALAMKPAPSTSTSTSSSSSMSPSSSRHSTPRFPPPLELRGGYLRPSGLYRGELRQQRPTMEKEKEGEGEGEEENKRRDLDLDLDLPRAAVLLRERVEALVERTRTSSSEISTVEEKEDEVEAVQLLYSEGELAEMYADLLAHPEAEAEAETQAATEKKIDPSLERKELLEAVVNRLIIPSDPGSSSASASASTDHESSPSLATRLAARQRTASPLQEDNAQNAESDPLAALEACLDSQYTHHNILLRLIDVARGLEGARRLVGDTANVPVTVLSEREWNALVYTCIEKEEMDIAENTLLLMKRSGTEPSEDLVNDVINVHAARGEVSVLVDLFRKLGIDKPTERQRDMHIKAHLKSPSPEHGIESALQVLHNYEALALLPSIKSYTRVIWHLFRARSTQLHAQAWDLFAHMRYVAHPKPDSLLYSLVLRACAGTGYYENGYGADPLRALDLWTEMTSDAGCAPTVGAYNGVILACARSKEHVVDAFRLAREMLDGHRDAYGNPKMQPTLETFNALLAAAKTRKDLPRARWILAEMLKAYALGVREGREKLVRPDKRSMVQVFNAYTAYVPPFRREGTRIVGESDVRAVVKTDGSTGEESTKGKDGEEVQTTNGRFGIKPPQTHSDVIAEADALFQRIIDETNAEKSSTESSPSSSPEEEIRPFAKIHVDGTLINTYISVYYMHSARLEDAKALYDGLFERLGVERTTRTYVEALERCARAARWERACARRFAEDVWKEWVEHEKTLDLNSAQARLIERAYAAMIRSYALNDDLDRALTLFRSFVTLYPPTTISSPSRPKSSMRSTRTMLFATRPIVRLTTPSEVPDDTVPPLLTPNDIELLHHRLVAKGLKRRRDVDYLTYWGNAYLGALRRRRDRTLRA